MKLVSVFLAVICTAFGQNQITIQVRNEAPVPVHILRGAEAEATWIFAKAGIPVVWLHCSDPEYPDGRGQACKESWDPRFFSMSVLAGAVQGTAKSSLGFALPRVGRGNHAAVFYGRIIEEVRNNAGCIAPQVLLAHAITHELGHLLAGSVNHGEMIMKDSWREADFRKMSQRRFILTQAEREQFRAGLMLRAERYQQTDVAQ